MANKHIDDATFGLQKKQGKRLKQEMKARNLSRQDICDLIYRESPTTVTRYCKGETAIPDDVFTTLADAWDLRVEYLRCEDDFRTVDDFLQWLQYMPSEKRKAFKACLSYLETLGLNCRPYARETSGRPVDISLLRSRDLIPDIDDIEKGKGYPSSLLYSDANNKDASFMVNFGFELQYENRLPCEISIAHFQDWISILDAVARSLIESAIFADGVEHATVSIVSKSALSG